jgi:hypothetical protein
MTESNKHKPPADNLKSSSVDRLENQRHVLGKVEERALKTARPAKYNNMIIQ